MPAQIPTVDEVRAIVREEVRTAVAVILAALPPAPLVTVARAAELAGVSLATMRRRIRSGTQPVVRRGRTVRVDPAGLRPLSAAEVLELSHSARHPAGRRARD